MRRVSYHSGAVARRAQRHAGLLGSWHRLSRGFRELAAPPERRPPAAAPAAVPAPAPDRGGERAPEFLDLQSLVQRLSRELPASPVRGGPVDEDAAERVSALLRQTRLNPREWRQHTVYRRGRYTRNIVGYSPGQFVALILCWERGQQSPIHDHSGAHCFIKMLSGQLREERFAWEESGGAGKEVLEDATLDAGHGPSSVGFMHDSYGLHRISNPSTEEAAVSLHIYSPPFSDCLVFPPTGAEPRRAPMVNVNTDWWTPNASWRAPPTPAQSLRGLCSALARLPAAEACARAFDLVMAADMSPLEWAMYASPAHFSEFHCVQHLVHTDQRFSVVVSCWSPGQGVPPHMLGRGRRTWIKVLNGSLQWQLFSQELFPGESDVERQKLLPEGSVSEMTECAVKLHNFKNASETDIAVSVQVFSPPLTQFTFQTKNGVMRQDLPTLLAELDPPNVSSEVNGSSPPHVNGSVPSRSAASSIIEAPGAGLRGLEHTAGRRYLAFQGLAALLDEEFLQPDPSDDAVSALLKKAVFNPEEWRTCLARAFLGGKDGGKGLRAAPQRVPLAQRRSYTLILSFWSQGDERQEFHADMPLGKSWTLMLEGELEERLLSSEGLPLHSYVLKEDGLSYRIDRQDGLRIWRRCDADVPCVSLHLHSPATMVDSTMAP